MWIDYFNKDIYKLVLSQVIPSNVLEDSGSVMTVAVRKFGCSKWILDSGHRVCTMFSHVL